MKSTELVKLNEDLEQKNREKYGKKDWDVISSAYRVSRSAGDAYAGFNAIKYINRFVGNSPKARNPLDLDKAIDYLLRMRENIPVEEKTEAKEVIEK
jgi:hypothetical protein